MQKIFEIRDILAFMYIMRSSLEKLLFMYFVEKGRVTMVIRLNPARLQFYLGLHQMFLVSSLDCILWFSILTTFT